MFANTNDSPARPTQLTSHFAIACDVIVDLGLPKRVAVESKVMASIAAMPETTIDENE
jgi:hypothetical protein